MCSRQSRTRDGCGLDKMACCSCVMGAEGREVCQAQDSVVLFLAIVPQKQCIETRLNG